MGCIHKSKREIMIYKNICWLWKICGNSVIIYEYANFSGALNKSYSFYNLFTEWPDNLKYLNDYN